MREIKLNKVNETIYESILDNKFKIILYPTTKSKNFYICLTTRLGAELLKYKKNNKTINLYPGTAHFLEHKVVDLSDEDKLKRLESLGSSPNAYTTYKNTSYEIYGSKDILKNIEVLFDTVFNFEVDEKSIENEKNIIGEEIDISKDDIYVELNSVINKNLFIKSPYKNQILGEKEDINKIDKSYLEQTYNSFYRLSNMFITITGNFDPCEVENFIKNYIKIIKTNKDIIKPIMIKEPDDINACYEEQEANVEIDKLAFAYKINMNNFKNYSKQEVLIYYNLLLDSILGSTSEFLEKVKRDNIISGERITYKALIINGYLIIKIIANTQKDKLFKEYLKKLLSNINVDEKTFNRKKKVILSNYILYYEDIETVNMFLTAEEIEYKKLPTDYYSLLNNMNYKDFNKIIFKFNNNKEVITRLYKK